MAIFNIQITSRDIERCMKNEGLIRNKMKIETAVNNAKHFLEIQKEFGTFSAYMWGFIDGKPLDGKKKSIREIPAVTKEAEIIAKDLKKRGFAFFGPTICYAHMQAVGMANDHTIDCFRHKLGKQGIIKESRKTKNI